MKGKQMTMTQVQERAIARLLAIKPVGRLGTGYRQMRSRNAIRAEFDKAMAKLGFTDASVQWADVQAMVELEKGAE